MRFFVFQTVALFFQLISLQSFATNISAINAGSTITSGTAQTIYFPILYTAGGGCASVSVYPNSLVKIDPTSSTNGILYFDVTPTSTLTAINDNVAVTDSNDVSIHIEDISYRDKVISLIPASGLTYTSVSGSYKGTNFIQYGTTDSTTRRIGISLPNVTFSGTTYKGYCTHLNDNYSVPANCQTSPTATPQSVTLEVGLIKSSYSLFSASTAKDTTTITIVAADCPASIDSGTSLPTQPTLSFALTPADGKINVFLANSAPTGNIPMQSTLILASAGTTSPGLGAESVTEFKGSLTPAKFEIEGMTNDQQYCVSIGYVNAAGFVTTVPNPTTAQCVTPSYIDGFLNRSTCFIATAAYGNEWDSRLNILRKFRDQILLKNSFGTKFVNWYYDWSPQAAHWLWEHDQYRPVIRILLQPFVWTAMTVLWIVSHLSLFLIFILLGISIVFISKKYKKNWIFLPILLLIPTFVYSADLDAEQIQPHIEALKRGEELQPKYKKSVDRAAGFSVVTSNTFDVTSNKTKANDFNSVYNPGEKYSLGIDLFYEQQIFRKANFAAIGIAGHAGVISTKGKGIFSKFKTVSDDTIYHFFAVPIGVGPSFRLTMLKILVPFVHFNIVGVPYLETRSDNKPMRRAIGASFSTNLGAALCLDWIHRASSWDSYESNDVLHTYLTFQGMWLRSFLGPVGFDYTAYYAGLTFEF